MRPQLLDRFGLSVEVRSPDDIEDRVGVIRRRAALDPNPDACVKKWAPEDEAVRDRILTARTNLNSTETPDDTLRDCAGLCVAIGSDGLRGELTLLRTAKALAAYEGSTSVTRAHLRRVAAMALSHRMRRDPLDDAGSSTRVMRTVEEVFA